MDRKRLTLKWWGRRAWLGGGGRGKNNNKEPNKKVQQTNGSSSSPKKPAASAAACNRHLSSFLASSSSSEQEETTSPQRSPTPPRAAAEKDDSHYDFPSQHDDNDDKAVSNCSIMQRKRTRRVQTHPQDDLQKSATTDSEQSSEEPPNSILKTAPTSPSKRRSIRFADEEGMPMATVRFSERAEDSHNWVRFIVLMVAPAKKKFEFVHVYYNTEDANPISDVLRHVREISTHRILSKQRYVGLCRLSDGGSEMLNCNLLQSYQLERHEVIAAIPKGMKAGELLPVAHHIVGANRKILKIMKRTKWEKKRIPRHHYKKKRKKLEAVPEGIENDDATQEEEEEESISLAELEDALPGEEHANDGNDLHLVEQVPRLVQAGAFMVPLMSVRLRKPEMSSSSRNLVLKQKPQKQWKKSNNS